MPITAEGRWFKDETGRTRILRGVNLSGGSKVPAEPLGYTHLPESLDERRDVSFVGRPVPLEEADEHFLRLKHWGLDFLRLVVTWEALEHQAPGSYDEAYLDYIEALIEKAQGHDINLFIDPPPRCLEPLQRWRWRARLDLRPGRAGDRQLRNHRRRPAASAAFGPFPRN